MKPILIDSRVVKILGFLAVLITVFAFAGGYLFGYQQAKDLSATDNESGSLLSLINSTGADSDIEQQTPEVVDAGDKNSADTTDNITPLASTNGVVAKADAETTEENAKQDVKVTQVASSLPVDKKPATQNTTDKPKKIKFSIQVGIYGRLKNAQKMQRKLQAQNLDAYISSFKNKENKVRFNVRFGYFKNLKFANIALDDYKNNKKGSGYVVNFSDKNIIHSETDDIEPVAKEPAPVSKPVDINTQKTSETGNALPAQEVMTEPNKGLVN